MGGLKPKASDYDIGRIKELVGGEGLGLMRKAMSMSRKNLLRIVSVSVMSLLLSAGPAIGQEGRTESIKNLNTEMMELYQDGNYTESSNWRRKLLPGPRLP